MANFPDLSKIVALFASDSDGEVLAAVAALKRKLAAANLTLNDLANAMVGLKAGTAPVSPPWSAPSKRQKPAGVRPWSKIADWLLMERDDSFRERELDFLWTIVQQKWYPTPKQWKWLNDIAARYDCPFSDNFSDTDQEVPF